MLNQIPNSTSGGGSIKVVTKSGSTVIGTKLTSFTLLAPSSVIPTWTSVTQADPVTSPVDIPTIVGAYVQGLSKVRGTITGAAGVYSSTIASKNFTVAGQTVNVSGTAATTPNPITATGTVPVVFKITDSRGRIKTQTNNITVLPYTPPAITAVSLDRSTSAGVADVNGTYIKVNLNASVQSLMNSTERNRLTVKAYTSPIGAGTWTLRSTPVDASTTLTYGGSFWFTMSGGFSANTAYDVRVEVSDQFGVVLFEDTLTIGGLFLDFNEGLGVLKEWEQGSIDAEGEIYHRDGSLVEPVGIVSIFAGATAPAGWLICDGAAVSRTTYAALWTAIGTAYGAGNGTSTFNLPNLKGRIPVGLDTAQSEFNVLGETGGEKTHLLTADETGVSEHYHVIRGAGNATPGGTTDGQARGSGTLDSGFRTGGTASSATYGSGSGNRSAAQAHNNIQPYVTMNYIIKAL
jgi:microcystin-dependent protein